MDLPVTTLTPAETAQPVQTVLPGDGIWVVDSLDGRPIIEEAVVTLRIGENRLDGIDGCNAYGGRFEEGTLVTGADGLLSVPPLGATAMDCVEPEGVMEQADAYISALIQGERYRVAGDRLEIFDSEGATRLVFVSQAPLSGHPTDLEGTSWRLLMEGDAEGAERAATLAFLNDRLVTGVTPCRAYLATYTTSEGSVHFPSTSMLRHDQSCSEESRRLEGEYTDFLTWAREYSVGQEGGSSRLRMWSIRGKTLIFEPLLPEVEDIAGAEWTLRTFVELRQGGGVPRRSSVIEGTEVTISFDKDGISGTSGCNSYTGQATVGDGAITIDVSTFSHTEKACEGPDGLMEQEERYLELVPRLTRYGIYGNRLFMQTDGDEFLLFQAK